MYDVAIIGCGVNGSLLARKLSQFDIKVIVIEKGNDIANGSSRANSAVVHAGYDPEPNTLKAILNVKGAKMMESLCKDIDVPYKKYPTLVVAFSEDQIQFLYELKERGEINGVENIKIIFKEELKAIEPLISDEAVAALYVDSALVSPYKLAIAAAEVAKLNGVEFLFDHTVNKIEYKDEKFHIDDEIEAKYIINCAGCGASKIASLIGDNSFDIIPRRGEYMLYDKSSLCVNNIIFTVPTEKGKGVLVLPTVDGNMLIGPNAEEVENENQKETSVEGLEFIFDNSKKIVPSLNTRGVISQFSGIRATPTTKDFVIRPSECNNKFLHVAGIESPGLASSPAICEYAFEQLISMGFEANKKENTNISRKGCPHFSSLTSEEQKALIKENPLFAHIICRCESITEAEIIDAIHRPLGARTIDGVKMRTRAGMGRCQGGFCSPKVAEILSRELNVNIETITKKGQDSYILVGKTKWVFLIRN